MISMCIFIWNKSTVTKQWQCELPFGLLTSNQNCKTGLSLQLEVQWYRKWSWKCSGWDTHTG